MPIDKIPREKLLGAIETLGPCQPIDIRKELKLGDTFLIGAMLSELVAEGVLAITKVRRGGSPFYYDVAKPERLDAVSKYLNEKDRRTYAMLKEERVMREDAQEPLVRVGLQNMADFSKRVEIDGVVYWRYFLTGEDEARSIVTPESVSKKKDEEISVMEPVAERGVVISTAAPDIAENASAAIAEDAVAPERPKRGKKKPGAKDAASTENSVQHMTAAGETATPRETKPVKKRSSKKGPAPTIMPDGAVMISPQEWLAHDTLYSRVQAFAAGMPIRDARVHKPHSELTCILTIEAQFGKIDVFAHAFNRKFVIDDIKATLPAARELGLPMLILSVDPIPSKITSAFKGMPNILFKTL